MPFAIACLAVSYLFPRFGIASDSSLRVREPGNTQDVALLRIALVRSGSVRQAAIIAGPGARLTDSLDSFLGKGPAEWTFTSEDGQIAVRAASGKLLIKGPAIRVEPGANDDPLALRINSAKPAVHYRGSLDIGPSFANSGNRGSIVSVYNVAPLETYLRGVVASEMAATVPAEALRAQAIASRTFALKARSRYTAKGFDLTDDIDCQAYGGVEAETPSTDAAIRYTRSQVLTRNSELIWADFYDDCGGVTAPGDDANDFPPSVLDAPDKGGSDYCELGAHHRWEAHLRGPEILARLQPTERAQLGHVRDLRTAATDSSGRIRSLEIVGTDGKRMLKGPVFRSILGYTRIMSTLFTVKRIGDEFLISGRGYGHGHGMCQCGAIGMAGEPFRKTCAEILEHYFPGSKIVRLGDIPIGRR